MSRRKNLQKYRLNTNLHVQHVKIRELGWLGQVRLGQVGLGQVVSGVVTIMLHPDPT